MTTPITGQGLNVCIPPDDELSLTSKKAAQNKVITEELTDLSNALSALTPATSLCVQRFLVIANNNYELNASNGLSKSNNSYKLIKYAVTAGERIHITSDHQFQFQSALSTPSSGTSTRVGDSTYGEFDGEIIVPSGATVIVLSTPKTDSTANVFSVYNITDGFGDFESVCSTTDLSLFENGMWLRQNGVATETIYWIRTKEYLSNDVLRVFTDNSLLSIYIEAWDSEDAYIGMWNNGSWSKTNTATNIQEIDVEGFRKLFPDYKFKLSINCSSASEGTCADLLYPDIIIQKKRTLVEKLSEQEQEIDSFADVSIKEYISYTKWISGAYASGDGVFYTTSVWMHTPKGIVDKMASVRCTNNTLLVFVMAFDQNGDYVGYYTGGGFVKVYNEGNARTSWDLFAIRQLYPEYTFVLAVRNRAGGSFVPSTYAGDFYFTEWTDLRNAVEELTDKKISDSIDEAVERIQSSTAVTNKVRICEWNIGHFANGGSQNSAVTSSDYETKRLAFRQYLNGIKADIIGVSEYSAVFCLAESSDAKDDIFGNYKSQYEGPQIRFSCNALFGDIGINNPTKHDYECNQTAEITHTTAIEATDYYYVESTIALGADTVTLIMTHCAFDTNNPQVAADQYDELIEKYANTAKVIIMGDLNWSTVDQLEVFTDAGYVGANNDWLGSIATYPGSSKGLDCIYAKGVQIANIEVYSTQLSDHYAIACDIIA